MNRHEIVEHASQAVTAPVDPQPESIALATEEERSVQEASNDFLHLYARSVSRHQQWPWTELLDVASNRIFYRRETDVRVPCAAPRV
jgi:hypothetical protein